jgi:flavin-dependent dehydrogenase
VGDKNDRWIGLKCHFREMSAPPSVDLYFFEGGYCGVQPITSPCRSGYGAVVNACAMVKASVAANLQQALRGHPALRERSQSWQPLMDPVSTSPLIFHEPEPLRDGMLQVGDSATFVDPFIGDGISLALRSGSLAARCLVPAFRGERRFEQAAADYAMQYMERLAPVFRASSRLRNLMRWPMVVRKPVMSVLQRTPRITKQLVRMTR